MTKYVCRACDDTKSCEISCYYGINTLKCIMNYDYKPDWKELTFFEKIKIPVNFHDTMSRPLLAISERENKRLKTTIIMISHEKTRLHENIKGLEKIISYQAETINNVQDNLQQARRINLKFKNTIETLQKRIIQLCTPPPTNEAPEKKLTFKEWKAKQFCLSFFPDDLLERIWNVAQENKE